MPLPQVLLFYREIGQEKNACIPAGGFRDLHDKQRVVKPAIGHLPVLALQAVGKVADFIDQAVFGRLMIKNGMVCANLDFENRTLIGRTVKLDKAIFALDNLKRRAGGVFGGRANRKTVRIGEDDGTDVSIPLAAWLLKA